MPDARTHSDALGIYLSDPSGLGGGRHDAEFLPLEPVVLTTIPPIVLERFSAACGEGECRIVAAGANSLQFAAPGEALGTAVTVSADSSALLESATPGKSVRVYRDAGYSAADLAGEMAVRLVYGVNNTIGLADAVAAGGTQYGCVWLMNHGAVAVTAITVTAGSGYAVGLEVPAFGRVQEIANATTAPAAVTFAGSATVATLAPGERRALWLRRTLGATSASAGTLAAVTVAFTAAALAYTEILRGYYRVSDAAAAVYDLYLGADALPDFGGAPATSGALPLSSALAPGHRWYWALRQTNAVGLQGQNTLCREVLVGAGGEDATEALTDPEVLTLSSQQGGEVDIRLRYNGARDATLADTWRLYITTDGTDPDPVTDTPADTGISVTGFARPDVETVIALGPYDYGTEVRVIARVYSSTLDAESGSLAVHSVAVSTQVPLGPHCGAVSLGGYRGIGSSLMEGATAYGAASLRVATGESILEGSAEIFRAVLGGQRQFHTALEFWTVAQGAAGTSAPIEAVSANEIYINVGGIRRAKIDLTLGRIMATGFTHTDTLIDLPVIGPIYITDDATYIMIRHALTGRWTPAIKVDSAGQLTTTLDLYQEIA